MRAAIRSRPVVPTRARFALLVVAAAALVGTTLLVDSPGGHITTARGAGANEVTIALGAPTTLDPAIQGDAGSAAISAQLFESLTAFDSSLALRPALASSWDILDGGRRIVFHMRPGLTFSDGTPLTASDVVRSWLRLIDPATPSPLSSLMADVDGATAYEHRQADVSAVGLHANGNDVEVTLRQPAADFVAVVSSPSFGIVPPSVGRDADALRPGKLVASGGYTLSASTSTELTLTANTRYWAGPPAIQTVHVLTDLGGKSPVDAFANGDVDYTGIAPSDASWIAYDKILGPQLRSVPSLSVDYYGFDTTKPPFSDTRVRQAFAMAVNWRRLVTLSAGQDATPATSMVPPGIPGRTSADLAPAYDPAQAKALLAQAGFPGGAGFPKVTLVSAGYSYDEAIVKEIHDVLGVTVAYETMPFEQYFTRLSTDPPAFWSLSWVADYPGPNDFLGVLLGAGASSNYGGWQSDAFGAAIDAATSATDSAAATAAYEQAERVVARDVPLIPVSYSAGWALSRSDLLGAGQNGLGIVRLAGLAWANR